VGFVGGLVGLVFYFSGLFFFLLEWHLQQPRPIWHRRRFFKYHISGILKESMA